MALAIKDTHDPDAVLDYFVHWGPYVDDDGVQQPGWLYDGDAIASSIWKDPTNGLTVTKSGKTDTRATVWLTGGVPGATGTITNHIVTNLGREDDQTIKIKIKEK